MYTRLVLVIVQPIALFVGVSWPFVYAHMGQWLGERHWARTPDDDIGDVLQQPTATGNDKN